MQLILVVQIEIRKSKDGRKLLKSSVSNATHQKQRSQISDLVVIGRTHSNGQADDRGV